MDCVTCHEVSQRYIDGELDDSQVVGFQQHLSFCGECAAELQELAGARVMLRATREVTVDVPAGFADRVMATLEAQPGPSSSNAPSRRRPAACCPAACRAASAVTPTTASRGRRGRRPAAQVRTQARRTRGPSMSTTVALTRAQIEELIPHRPPFLLAPLASSSSCPASAATPAAARAPTTGGLPGTSPATPSCPAC